MRLIRKLYWICQMPSNMRFKRLISTLFDIDINDLPDAKCHCGSRKLRRTFVNQTKINLLSAAPAFLLVVSFFLVIHYDAGNFHATNTIPMIFNDFYYGAHIPIKQQQQQKRKQRVFPQVVQVVNDVRFFTMGSCIKT